MSEQAPAGWYPDGQGNERFWDGASWTESVRAASALPPAPAEPGVKKVNAFTKLTASVKQGVADRQSAKEEAARQHHADAESAGALITSGVFGSSTVEIYQGGYVRVAVGSEDQQAAAAITKKTPYEKLRSIKYKPSDAERAAAAPSSALDSAVGSVMNSLFKGGKNLVKSTVPGLAAAGVAHVASTGSRRSFLIVATDRSIHTLSNQTHNGFIKIANKGHTDVARELEAAGNAVLGVSDASALPAVAEPNAVPAMAVAAHPTLAERLREIAGLHQEGILSDEEFATAKAKLLSGL